jgi:glycosyltransferase involved in cell wall biosynthesis
LKIIILRGRAIDSAPYKLAETLSQRGLDVRLLVWDRQHDLESANEAKGYKLDRFSIRAPYDRATALLYQPLWYLYTFIYLLRDDADVVHAIDLDTLWPAVLAKMIKRNKLYYTIYDFYANNFPDSRPRFLMGIIRKTFELAEKAGIRFTDTLFLTDEHRYEEVRGANIKKLVYVYNTPVDTVKTAESVPVKRGYTEIFYAGAIAPDRESWLKELLNAVENIDDVRLVFAGKDNIGLMENLPGKLKDRVEYLGWISHDEVLRRTLDTDILFRLSDPRYPKSKYESPYKVFEAMMSGKPIIVSADTRAGQLVGEENCGIAVKYGDMSALKEAIVNLKDNPGLRRSLGQNGRQAYDNKYSWTVMEKRLLDAYGVK